MNPKRLNITPRIGGAVYVLPNLLTTGNLFFGFFSIIKSMQGDFAWASAAILLASIFDILDGRVARLTHGSSEFGVQYDSLCDLVSFGAAPAFLMYQRALNDLGRFGWSMCFIFLACGALRLARFNVQSYIGKTNDDFTGLPIPMAAGVIACLVSLTSDLKSEGQAPFEWMESFFQVIISDSFHKGFFLIAAPLLAFLMVSNVRYRSHKTIKLGSIKPFHLLAIFVGILGLAAYKPPLAGFIFFFIFALSGLLEWMMGWKKAISDDEIFRPHAEGSSIMEPTLSSQDQEDEDEKRGKD